MTTAICLGTRPEIIKLWSFIKILKKLLTYSIYWVNKHLDLNTDTRVYIKSNCNIKNILQINNLRVDKIDKQVAQVVADFYCQHYFNILGSGWVPVHYDSKPFGVEGFKYNCNITLPEIKADGNWLSRILLPSHTISAKKIWQHA